MRVHLRSTPLLIPYSYSTYKCLQLLLPCRSVPIREKSAPQGGLKKLPETAYPIGRYLKICRCETFRHCRYLLVTARFVDNL